MGRRSLPSAESPSTDKNTTSTNSANASANTWANSPRTREPSKLEPQSAPQNQPSSRLLLPPLFCRYFFANFLTLHTSLFCLLLRHNVSQRHVITSCESLLLLLLNLLLFYCCCCRYRPSGYEKKHK